MKKGYRRLLIFNIIVIIVLFLNSFVWNILSRYIMNIFFVGLLVLFRVFFGFEKDRHRYIKDILMEVFIFLMLYFMLYYLLGIIVSFSRVGNYYNLRGLIEFIIPTILLVIFREFLRYQVLTKASGSKIVTVVSIVMFIFLDISSAIYYGNFKSNYSTFMFIALVLLPSISNNIAYSYVSLRVGYKPVMFYALVMSLYSYLIPIIPNPTNYLKSVINLMVPMLLMWRVNEFFKKDRDQEVERDYGRRYYGFLIIPFITIVILVYFTSGYFHYWAIAVASGSMSPAIKKGDVVIVENIKDNYKEIEKGDVLVFRYDGVVVIHRIVNVIKDRGKYYFYTKGDANNNDDDFVIEEDKVIGVVKGRIPIIGGPTVWLNEL